MLRCLQCNNQLSQRQSKILIEELNEKGITCVDNMQDFMYLTKDPFCGKIDKSNYILDNKENVASRR